MKIRKGVQKLSEAVFCIPHRRDNAFFPSSLFITYVLISIMGIGILIGGGKAIHNYAVSFKNNVKPEHI